MSSQQYIDTVVHPLNIPKSKPMKVINGAGRYIDSSNINSGKKKKIPVQYIYLPYSAGNQSTQSQIEEYLIRKNKQSGGSRPMNDDTLDPNGNVIGIRPFYQRKNTDTLYSK